MDPWDYPTEELPTKFNKYKRLREREKLREAARLVEGASGSDSEPCISTATGTSSSSVITSSQAVSIPQHHQLQQPQHQQDANIGSLPLRIDDDERTDAKLMKCSVDSCSAWRPDNLNGSVPTTGHPRNSPDHCSRRIHRPDSSPYHMRMMDRSPLRQQIADRSMPLQRCPGSWQLQLGSSFERNGLVSLDHMDTSDDMPLNLSTGVRSSVHQSTYLDNRRRILTSESSSTRVVDEHFERSLGSEYAKLLKHPAAPSSAPPASSSFDTSPLSATGNHPAASGHISGSVLGAVDDHFRKSLGSAWHSAPTHEHTDQPDSVDDHFARALGGDTWLRIKADHERSTSVPPYSALSYYPT